MEGNQSNPSIHREREGEKASTESAGQDDPSTLQTCYPYQMPGPGQSASNAQWTTQAKLGLSSHINDFDDLGFFGLRCPSHRFW
jgi:hypothetical protein